MGWRVMELQARNMMDGWMDGMKGEAKTVSHRPTDRQTRTRTHTRVQSHEARQAPIACEDPTSSSIIHRAVSCVGCLSSACLPVCLDNPSHVN
mmetsp:Transcript_52971/g.133357  ORF Transcript_52971/g.133357 Transcript_52971/m.133357 type:complete len:93 (+) Transcript_52971:536-814(+)